MSRTASPAGTPAPSAAEADEGVVGPLERGLAVLRTMARPGNQRLRPSDLVHATGLARATVDRVVGTLIRLDYLRTAGRDVELTPRVMEFGNAYLTGCGIPDALGPFARRLADELDESVSLAVPDGDGARFVTQVTRRRTMSLTFRAGDLLPAERCAAGALFAAGWTGEQLAAWRERRRADPAYEGFAALPRRPAQAAATGADADADADDFAGDTFFEDALFERRAAEAAASGWSADDQLVEPGLIAVAVPVRDADGRTACAVSVVSHTSRHTVGTLREAVLPPLHEAVPAMERALTEAERSRPGVRTGPADGADPARVAKQELGAGFLQSLARGLGVLVALGDAPGGRTLSEVAESCGLARATARRSLITLQRLGYAEARGRRFRPAPRVLELGYTQLSRLDFTDIARPHLERLAAQVHESASMAVLDGDDIRYVARVPTYRIMSVDITLGTRFPAYATSMGRVLLSGLGQAERTAHLERAFLRPLTRHTVTSPAALARILDEVAASGHALVDEELEEGLRALAVPVRDRQGRTVAAVNVSTHTGRGTVEESRATLLPPLVEAAARIEADLHTASARAPLQLP